MDGDGADLSIAPRQPEHQRPGPGGGAWPRRWRSRPASGPCWSSARSRPAPAAACPPDGYWGWPRRSCWPGSAVSEPAVAPVLGVIGWLTVVGFSRAPYAQLRPTGSLALTAALVIAGCTLAGVTGGLVLRRAASSFTLWIVDVSGEPQPDEEPVTGLPADWSLPEPAQAAGTSPPPGRPGRPAPPPPAVPRPDRRHRPPPAGLRRRAAGGRAAAADPGAVGGPDAPPRRRPAGLPGRRGRGGGRGRLLARRGGRHRGQPAGQLVLHPARAHADHRRRGEPALAAAVHHRRRHREQRRAPGRAPGPAGGQRPRGRPRNCWPWPRRCSAARTRRRRCWPT